MSDLKSDSSVILNKLDLGNIVYSQPPISLKDNIILDKNKLSLSLILPIPQVTIPLQYRQCGKQFLIEDPAIPPHMLPIPLLLPSISRPVLKPYRQVICACFMVLADGQVQLVVG